MACVREPSIEGRIGTFQCDAEDCQFRFKSAGGGFIPTEDSPTIDCVLQLRLRAGDAEDAGRWKHDEGRVVGKYDPSYGRVISIAKLYGNEESVKECDDADPFTLIQERYIKAGMLSDSRVMLYGVEWDIVENLPMYTRDYLRMQREGKI